jgi:hypothetical protein
MPIQGFRRFRKHQVGVQSSFSSNTSATRVLPYRGAIDVDPALVIPDVDTGSLDPMLAPYAGAAVYGGTWGDGKLAYDDAPWLWALLLKSSGAPTGGGTAKTHTFQAASLTADPFAYVTDQWGDDVTTDWLIGGSGIINELTTGFGDDLGAWDVSAALIYARANIGGPTGGLTVTASPVWVYGADTEVFVDTVAASIGTTKWTDAVHGAELKVGGNNDLKRFANGSNTRFQLSGYGRGGRQIDVTIRTAKTTETIAERAAADSTSAPGPLRYLELRSTAPDIITGTTPYSQSIRMPARLMKATDVEFGDNNTGYEFTYRGVYDATLTYAIRVVVVCTTTTTF